MMKKTLWGLAAALMLTACNDNKMQQTGTDIDSAKVMTELMMS